MTMNYLRKPSNLFWVISSIALVWNLMGVFNYLDQAFMTDKILETLPKEQQILYQDVPAWVTAAFAIAVFSGTLGSLLLLLKKKIATTFFIISFLGIVGQMSYGLLIDQNSDSYGPMGIAMPIIIIAFGGYLIWYSRKANEHRWLS
jgi:CHASE2 domain-containing sensor protein